MSRSLESYLEINFEKLPSLTLSTDPDMLKMNFVIEKNRSEGVMKTISMVEFRRDAWSVVLRVTKGERLALRHGRKSVMRLEPIWDEVVMPNQDQ